MQMCGHAEGSAANVWLMALVGLWMSQMLIPSFSTSRERKPSRLRLMTVMSAVSAVASILGGLLGHHIDPFHVIRGWTLILQIALVVCVGFHLWNARSAKGTDAVPLRTFDVAILSYTLLFLSSLFFGLCLSPIAVNPMWFGIPAALATGLRCASILQDAS